MDFSTQPNQLRFENEAELNLFEAALSFNYRIAMITNPDPPRPAQFCKKDLNAKAWDRGIFIFGFFLS